ncbi:MAG: hypothetical protein Q8O93_03470 [bacterium]|nr:hypothetical protein [bacterium]
MKNSELKPNWPIVGNGHIFDFLGKSLKAGKVSGSYIFSGPANLGKATAAHFFAQSLVCEAQSGKITPCGACPACSQAAKGIHGDIYLIKREEDKKNILVEQIREFIKNLGMSSFLNSYKIGIIKGAESLNESGFNALLKTLEEPKNKVVIILTTSDFEALPKTIVSRSQLLRFRPVPANVIYDDLIANHQASRSQAKNFSRLSAGRPALALKFLRDQQYYENYGRAVKAFSGLLNADVNERLAAIEDILGKESRGQDAAAAAAETISVWQNLARDLMLYDLNLADLIQHEAFTGELAAAGGGFNLKSILNLLKNLKQAKRYIGANVNPKLSLEKVAVSF